MKKVIVICLSFALFCSCTKEYNYYNTYVTNVDSIYTSYYYQTVLADQQVISDDVRPNYLKAGDTVGIFAISGIVTESGMASGIKKLKDWGLHVIEADNLYNSDTRYAGTQSERIEGFQKLINNKSIKALIGARGGYGAVQVIPFIDFSPLESNPKWIVGFSDVTAIHMLLNNRGLETIHGPMVNNFSNTESVESLRKALFGELQSSTFETNSDCNEGTATGRLVGGNLTLIYSFGGTMYDLNVKDAILLIEDTGEANYNVDRMLNNLKLSGKLDELKGVIVGNFTNMSQGSDKPINQIIHDNFDELNIPILFNASIGHDKKNIATYLGRTITLTVEEKTATITY